MRVLVFSSVYKFHILIVQSKDPEARYTWLGENATLNIVLEWPVSLTREQIEQFSILDIYSFLFGNSDFD